MIAIIREQQATALHAINDLSRDGFAQGGTSPTTSEAPLRARKRLAHGRRAVHHDRPFTCPIVKTLIEAVKAK